METLPKKWTTMKTTATYIDLGFCFVFLPLMIYMFPVERWWGTYPVFFGSFVGWLYVTYFSYKYYIIPQLFHKGRHRTHALLAMCASLAVTLAFASYDITSPYYHERMASALPNAYPLWGVRHNQQAVWIHYIIVVICCLAMGMLTEAYRQRMAREEVEYERNKAELALYKAQINPHFLFNTLNTIYGLLITHSDKTEATLQRFINLTRYMYDNANRDYIPLSDEVEYISQYIDLQRLRLNSLADVSFTFDIADPAAVIPPMLLITFVENAFKYGVSSNEPCFIHIRLCQDADTISFSTQNAVFQRTGKASRHTGIDNCRRRLALLYPDSHSLCLGAAADGTFNVRLELKNRHL